MQIFDRSAVAAGLMLALVGVVGLPADAPAAGSTPHQVTFKSPEAAYEQGMGAWRSGFLDRAVPAFEYASQHDVFLATFYLARIYSDSNTSFTDHPAAYKLYQRIVDGFADIDPDDDQRAPFVARSLTALAIYVKDGIEAADLKPDPARAIQYLRHAAQFFNNEDAQFELSKLYLKGEGVEADPRMAMHYLSLLAQHGHAGAQAFLADIYWRGRYGIARDQLKAYALISVAMDNAPDTERIWIEDIYQNIFCGASQGTRVQAQGMVADWRRRYGRASVASSERFSLGGLPPRADRTCSNGEPVNTATPGASAPRTSGALPSTALGMMPASSLMPGSVMDVGITRDEPAR